MADESGSRLFETLLEEYKVQRTAVGEKLSWVQHTITFGGATTGILVAAGFNVWDQPVPATLIFLVAIPLISAAVVVQWVGLGRSLEGTHHYINALEDAMLLILREHADVPAALFSKRTPRTWPADERWFQNAAIAVFGLLALGSMAVGIYKGWADYTTRSSSSDG